MKAAYRYSKETASYYIKENKPVRSLSVELEPQQSFVDDKLQVKLQLTKPGLRDNEGTALWWNDIDFNKKELRVHLIKSTIFIIIKRYAKLADVPAIQARGLRHSHASYLINEVNASVLIVSLVLK